MTMKRPGRLIIASRLLGALLLALALAPGVAAACVIDNTASLSANGIRATPTTTAPRDGGLWAQFTVGKAFASRAPVQFAELRSDLVRSLPPASLATPFRWAFGDGATALGHTATHRYAHPGLYRLTVYGFAQRTHSWFPFDNVLVRIVPPAQVVQANLGYYALRALDVVMSGVMWLIDAALILLVLIALRSRLRSRRREPTAQRGSRPLRHSRP
jgi:PKD domain